MIGGPVTIRLAARPIHITHIAPSPRDGTPIVHRYTEMSPTNRYTVDTLIHNQRRFGPLAALQAHDGTRWTVGRVSFEIHPQSFPPRDVITYLDSEWREIVMILHTRIPTSGCERIRRFSYHQQSDTYIPIDESIPNPPRGRR